MKHNLLGLVWLSTTLLVLSACSGGPTTTPTNDPATVYTQAASTVEANLKLTEASKPTSTVTPTPEPTATLEATATTNAPAVNTTPDPNASPTPQGTQVQPTPTGQTTPTATSNAPKPTVDLPDKGELAGQSPSDNAQKHKNETFPIEFTLKNTGSTTWTTGYTLRYYAGERMASPSDLNLQNEVKPGESIKLVFNLVAPSDKTGQTRTFWVLTNADGQNFYTIYLDLEIIE